MFILMSEMIHSIETSTSFITYNESNRILTVTAKNEVELTLENATRDFEVSAKMANYDKVLVLVDSRKQLSHSKEVRDFYGSKKMEDHILAMAVMVDSVATRLTANFFIKFNKPYFPTKLFTDEKEARKWLLENSGM